jgi:hypothetical protein
MAASPQSHACCCVYGSMVWGSYDADSAAAFSRITLQNSSR